MTQKKRLTQRQKTENARLKKHLQAEGILPPDKPRLNRKKFAAEGRTQYTIGEYIDKVVLPITKL